MQVMLRRLLGEDVKLSTDLAADLGAVKADAGQLEQVLLNLAVNARDAMPRGGALLLVTANVEVNAEQAAQLPDVTPGPYVCLRCHDTGCGMSEEVLAHLFEPFFSTKGDKGTGLGLATVYGIVKQSGGYIRVASTPGQGTTFQVFLPRTAERPQPADRPSARTAPALGNAPGTETVLLVEDEDSVRQLARMVLQQQGYRVLEAADPAAALALCERHRGPIHLLLSDVIMPGMNGPTLSGHLRAVRPSLRVLFMSGFTDSALLRHGIQEGDVEFLLKPFRPVELARRVREALDRPLGPRSAELSATGVR
jgi:CheY-like chemotaxis protein